MTDRAQACLLLALAAVLLIVALVFAAQRSAEIDRIAASQPVRLRIDPNTADEPTLCLLPGIGPSLALRIIEDRQAHGPYQSVEDLARVPGIGEKTVAVLRPWVGFADQEP